MFPVNYIDGDPADNSVRIFIDSIDDIDGTLIVINNKDEPEVIVTKSLPNIDVIDKDNVDEFCKTWFPSGKDSVAQFNAVAPLKQEDVTATAEFLYKVIEQIKGKEL